MPEQRPVHDHGKLESSLQEDNANELRRMLLLPKACALPTSMERDPVCFDACTGTILQGIPVPLHCSTLVGLFFGDTQALQLRSLCTLRSGNDAKPSATCAACAGPPIHRAGEGGGCDGVALGVQVLVGTLRSTRRQEIVRTPC
jgi:hypothetical protein